VFLPSIFVGNYFMIFMKINGFPDFARGQSKIEIYGKYREIGIVQKNL
jgi:hypothetical protein